MNKHKGLLVLEEVAEMDSSGSVAEVIENLRGESLSARHMILEYTYSRTDAEVEAVEAYLNGMVEIGG